MNTTTLPQESLPDAEVCELDLGIGGMTCASCVSRVEKALKKQPGVMAATVNLATETARVSLNTADTPDSTEALARLKRAVRDAGYEPRAVEAMDEEVAKGWLGVPRDAWPVILGALLSAPLALPMVGDLAGKHWMLPAWIQFLLATPVQFVLGARFYKAGWHALKALTGNMELLVAIGTTAGWALSTWLWWRADAGEMVHLYYEGSAVVITLVLLGKWLEARAKRQTTEAIRALHALRPENAHLLPDGVRRTELTDVPVDELLPGDVIRVLPGERFAADGTVVAGSTQADESMLTGEAMPVHKTVGDAVTGGSLNGEGAVEVRVRAVGAQSVLSRIIALVQDAQAGKAPVQRMVDQVAAVFVPAVLVIALITLGAWLWQGALLEDALLHAVAVLVIACPCALGLATPAAIMAGTGVAARHGVLIQDPQALETTHRVQVVAFDKTGTLTVGQPSLAGWDALPDGTWPAGREGALAVAAALQAGSEHPLAQAVLNAAVDAPLRLQAQDLKAHPGRGIEGRLPVDADGSSGEPAGWAWAGLWRLGSQRWLGELVAGSVDPGLASVAQAWTSTGRSVSWLMRHTEAGWQPVAVFGFGDEAKAESREAVARLQAMGVYTVMISGDNRGAARAVAEALGIQEVIAEVLPGDKADHIRRLQHGPDGQRRTVAMVGDGINDAPALAAADVGMAMANPQGGTDVAMQAAGVTLMRGDPRLVASAIEVSRRTTAKIWQNLVWAFGYNVIGIPLAAMGELSPMLAGAAMAFSSVSVVLNALWLSRWRPRNGAMA